METVIPREVLTQNLYREILDVETHHDHEIVEIDGVYRWKENKDVERILDDINLNSLIMLLHSLGYDKNSEVYRKLYRDMGYSLYGYWEIFYWEVNNEEAHEYKPNTK